MKKPLRNTLIIALLALALGIAWYFAGSSMRELKELKAPDIKEIFIAHPAGYYTITRQEDIQILLDALKSIDNIRKVPEMKDGGTVIDIKLKDGETMNISLRSEDIVINRQHYKATQAYYNKISEVFQLLSKEYDMKTN
ncbi:hypothetical protein ACPWSR_11340 [Alloiococcus sp. CFN-8]|uniref:hypothetical protein n=1 Tax=Alloiococcus sp. CFN-8 TaxID=3416081 RepID=UPI003CEE6D5F